MDKRFSGSVISRIYPIRAWHFLVLAIAFLGIGLLQMRSNYAHMVVLRDRVYAADKSGVGVDQALQDLRDYVGHHMNTSLSSGDNGVYPPIQLRYTYERLIEQKTGKSNDANATIYKNAQKYCEAKIPNYTIGKYRVSCIESYVKRHNVSRTYISPDLYKFDFYSPTWAPDIAGISLLLSCLCAATFIVTIVTRRLFPTT